MTAMAFFLAKIDHATVPGLQPCRFAPAVEGFGHSPAASTGVGTRATALAIIGSGEAMTPAGS